MSLVKKQQLVPHSAPLYAWIHAVIARSPSWNGSPVVAPSRQSAAAAAAAAPAVSMVDYLDWSEHDLLNSLVLVCLQPPSPSLSSSSTSPAGIPLSSHSPHYRMSTLSVIPCDLGKNETRLIDLVERFLPSTTFQHLFLSPSFEWLLSLVGDRVMCYLFEHSLMFLPLANGCFCQISGVPLSDVVSPSLFDSRPATPYRVIPPPFAFRHPPVLADSESLPSHVWADPLTVGAVNQAIPLPPEDTIDILSQDPAELGDRLTVGVPPIVAVIRSNRRRSKGRRKRETSTGNLAPMEEDDAGEPVRGTGKRKFEEGDSDPAVKRARTDNHLGLPPKLVLILPLPGQLRAGVLFSPPDSAAGQKVRGKRRSRQKRRPKKPSLGREPSPPRPPPKKKPLSRSSSNMDTFVPPPAFLPSLLPQQTKAMAASTPAATTSVPTPSRRSFKRHRIFHCRPWVFSSKVRFSLPARRERILFFRPENTSYIG